MKRNARRSGRYIDKVLGAVVATALVAIGCAGGAWWASLASDAVPEDVRRDSSPVAAVTTEMFEDPQPVTLQTEASADIAVFSQSGGVLTSFTCSVGEEIPSGSVVARVNSTSIMALHTESPLWRTVGVGDAGDDVRAFLQAVSDLGAPVSVDSTMTYARSVAVREWLESFGLSNADSRYSWSAPVVNLENFAWLPAPQVAVASCDLAAGAPVSVGDALFTTAGALSAVSVRASSPGEGDVTRTLLVDDVRIQVPPDNKITDREALDALVSTATFRARSEGDADDANGVSAQWVLTTPIEIGVVPPASVLDLTGSRGCVKDPEGNATAVTIVSSTLGRTLVVADGGAELPSRVVIDGPGTDTCG